MESTIQLATTIDQDFIEVKTGHKEKGTMQIYNRMGNTLKQVVSDEIIHRIDISDIPEGVYFMKVQLGDASKIIRFTKN